MAGSKEDAKNLALLFFMDHLMQKNGKRTIHDLSCQFGARGFTAEMRDAVGGTQESLLDFLQQFPSLFSIDDDAVTLNGYGDEGITIGGFRVKPVLQTLTRDRDIEKEAVEFFELKLKRFGPEMQIKSLLGHRSQAAPEIRLYSGRHVKDFTEFLQAHSENFVVENDRVRLTDMPEPCDPILDLDERGQPLCGERAKQAAVDYLKMLVEIQDAPLPMETLYKQFCTRFSHSVRQEVATNPKELLQFLKQNRSLFFIRSNKVSIVRNRLLDGGTSSDEGGASPSPLFFDGANQIAGIDGSIDRSIDILQITTVLKSLKSAQEAMQEVASMYTDGKIPLLDAELSNVVAMDFKVVNLGVGQDFLALVTVGTPFGKLYVFDLANSSSILLESGLKDLLEADDYIKVIHDCKRISTLLWQQYKITIRTVFDTQIANTILQHQRTGRPLHEVKPISHWTLQRLYFPQSLANSEEGHKKLQRPDSRYWSLRPLTDEMICLAVEEVQILVPAIFLSMTSAIRPELRDLFWHLCRENANFFIKPQEVQIQRQERRNQYVLNLVNEKLMHDPTGFSLSNREKKVLANVQENLPINGNPIQQQQDYYVPRTSSGLIYTTAPLQNTPPAPVCACHCHKLNVKIDAAVQTFITGEFIIGNELEE